MNSKFVSMNNQRFKSDINQNMGRRYRGKYNPKTRTKWDNRMASDLNVSVSGSDGKVFNSRQIRFNTTRDDNRSDNSYNNNRRHDNQYRDHSDNNRGYNNDRNWSRSRGSRNRQNYSQSLRNNRRNQQSFQNNDRNRDDIDSQWFKITIPHGNKYDKDFILRSIQDATQLTFTPYNYRSENGSVVFFVLGADTADSLRSISRRITTPNGMKLIVLSNRSAIPPTPIDEELTQIIKTVMSNRYNADTKVMDLSKFREDSNLQQLGLYVPLSRPNMLNSVIKIIIENTPDIIGLNLRDNKLSSLEPLISLITVCQFLKAIDLSLNQIRNATELDFLKGLDLLELALDGNPICESFEDQAAYISCIRSRFPKLIKLDGEELPAPIGFDVQETSNLPQSLPSYLPEDIQKFIHGFFEAYYNIYDSDDRQGLLQAYHDQALFSLSISRQDNSSHRFPEELIQESRNLLRVKDFSLRNKLIKNGKINIVSALCEMPKSKHEPNSFVIDVPFCNNAFVLVVVNGVYRELLKKHQPLRAFCRTFYIVPQGQGFVIVNDVLLLTNATVAQIQKYSQTNKITTTDKMMADLESNTKSILRVSSGDQSTDKYESVICKFMNATRMNRSFAVQCLEENNYNMESAYAVFQKLRTENLIPPEAFDDN